MNVASGLSPRGADSASSPDPQCPPHSQECAPGYYRDVKGLFLGRCIPCQCHSHSDRCLPGSGVCVVSGAPAEVGQAPRAWTREIQGPLGLEAWGRELRWVGHHRPWSPGLWQDGVGLFGPAGGKQAHPSPLLALTCPFRLRAASTTPRATTVSAVGPALCAVGPRTLEPPASAAPVPLLCLPTSTLGRLLRALSRGHASWSWSRARSPPPPAVGSLLPSLGPRAGPCCGTPAPGAGAA